MAPVSWGGVGDVRGGDDEEPGAEALEGGAEGEGMILEGGGDGGDVAVHEIELEDLVVAVGADADGGVGPGQEAAADERVAHRGAEFDAAVADEERLVVVGLAEEVERRGDLPSLRVGDGDDAGDVGEGVGELVVADGLEEGEFALCVVGGASVDAGGGLSEVEDGAAVLAELGEEAEGGGADGAESGDEDGAVGGAVDGEPAVVGEGGVS